MPDVLEGSQPVYAGAQERMAQSAAIDADYKGISGTLNAAVDSNFTGDIGRFIARNLEYTNDPNWSLTRERLDQLTPGISQDLWPMFSEARSADDAAGIRGILLSQMDNRKSLLAAGKFGTSAAMAANVFDPTFLLAGTLTGGLATATKAGMLARMAYGGLVTGGTFAALEGVRAEIAPTEQPGRNILQTGTGAFALGALGPVTAGLGRLPRALATGGAAATASYLTDKAYGAVTGDPTPGVWGNAAQQFAVMGLLSSLHGKPQEVATGRAMHEAGVDAVKDDLYRTAVENGATLTPEGKAFFAAQIDPQPRLDVHGADLAAQVAADYEAVNVEAARIHAAYDIAESRLSPYATDPFPADHRLNRTEVNQVLEGTGRKAGNQGFPTPEELKFMLRDLRNEDLFGTPSPERFTVGGGTTATKTEATQEMGTTVPISKSAAGAGFTTSKGSTYTIDGEGRTTRNKSYHPEHGTADVGPKPTSERTVYVTPEQAEDVGMHLSLNAEAKARVFIEGDKLVREMYSRLPTPEGGDRTKIHMGVRRVEVPFETAPRVGLAPVEFLPGGKVHPGNEIISVQSAGSPQPPVEGLGAASPSTIAKPAPTRPTKIVGDFDYSHVNPATSSLIRVGDIPIVGPLLNKARLGNIPIDIRAGARLFRSPDATLNLVARIFNGDRLPAADGSPAVLSSRQEVRAAVSAKNAALNRELTKLYGKHITQEKAAGRKPMKPEAWEEEITRAQWREPGTYTQDPTIDKGADLMRRVYASGRAMAERHEVPGWDQFGEDPTWTPHLFNRPAIDEYVHQYGQTNDLLNRFTEAVKAADVKRGQAAHAAGQTLMPIRQLSDVEAREMADSQIRNAGTGGTSAEDRVRKRIPFDPTYSWTTPDGATHEAGDFLYSRASDLGMLYNKQTAGASAAQAAFQRISDFMRPSGEAKGPTITSRAELLKALQQHYDESRQQGIDQAGLPSASQFKQDLAIVDALVRLTDGTPIRENTVGYRAARTVNNINILRNMANPATGIMNTSQIAGSMAQVGMQAAARQFGVPFVDLISQIKSGHVDSTLGREIQSLGFGDESAAHPVHPGMQVDEDGFSQIANKVEYLAAKGARASLGLSGHIVTIDWMRTAVGRVVSQVWLDAALSGKGMVEELGPKRLAALGLDPADPIVARIEQHIRDHAVTQGGPLGYKLVDSKTSQWSNPDGTHDVEAVAAYNRARGIAITRAVLIPDSTDLPLWMSNPVASLLVQFRKFALTSVRDRFGFNISMRDGAAMSSALLDVAGSAINYSLVIFLKSLVQPDPQEYRDKMLASGTLAAAAFGRASWMNIIPAAVDTTATNILGRKAIFEHARTTGLAGSLVEGNPTVDWINNAGRSIGALQAPFRDDYDFSRGDIDRIRKGWFIPSLFGSKELFQKIGGNLPEHSIER